MSPIVGVVGLGIMGTAIAGQLLDSGHAVYGYDIDSLKCAALAERGGTAVGSVAELAAPDGVVVISLATADSFGQVVGELAASRPRGLLVIDTSTLALDVKESGREELARVGATLLDCPLSGTGQQARSGDVVAYVSGPPDAVERAVPVLVGFTRGHHRLGAFGNGTRMKLVANLLVAVHNVAAAEAVLLARRSGLDPHTVLTAVGDGAGTSRMFEVRGPLMVAEQFEEATMRVDVFAKDLEIISHLAADTRTPTPIFDAAAVLYRQALLQGRGAQDTAAVYGMLKDLTEAAREPLSEPAGQPARRAGMT